MDNGSDPPTPFHIWKFLMKNMIPCSGLSMLVGAGTYLLLIFCYFKTWHGIKSNLKQLFESFSSLQKLTIIFQKYSLIF